jgi:hypothetical protein
MLRALSVSLLIAAVAPPALAAPPPACTAPEYRQFDFWVGRWKVSPTGKDTVVAESLIEKLFDGCAIRETWMPKANAGGGSLNGWRPGEKAWRQVWLDQSGVWVEFKGGWTGKAMVLEGAWPQGGKPATVRMTYSKNPDGSVRQMGEQSTDGGRTWAPSFDFTYRPAG